MTDLVGDFVLLIELLGGLGNGPGQRSPVGPGGSKEPGDHVLGGGRASLAGGRGGFALLNGGQGFDGDVGAVDECVVEEAGSGGRGTTVKLDHGLLCARLARGNDSQVG